VPPIGENEYDRLFVTTIIEGGATQASTLRYCEYKAELSAATPKMPASKTGNKAAMPKKK
jgi:hypothetical protein